MLSNRTYSLQIGDTMVVFWAESAEVDYQAVFMGCMDPPTDNQEELKGLFERIRLGRSVIHQGNELESGTKVLCSWISAKCGKIIRAVFL